MKRAAGRPIPIASFPAINLSGSFMADSSRPYERRGASSPQFSFTPSGVRVAPDFARSRSPPRVRTHVELEPFRPHDVHRALAEREGVVARPPRVPGDEPLGAVEVVSRQP